MGTMRRSRHLSPLGQLIRRLEGYADTAQLEDGGLVRGQWLLGSIAGLGALLVGTTMPPTGLLEPWHHMAHMIGLRAFLQNKEVPDEQGPRIRGSRA